MRWLILLSLPLVGCTGEILARLEQDIVALRERVQAREEVRIQVAGPTPAMKTGNVASNEPHVAIGCPEVAPVTRVRYVQREKSRKIKRKR